MIIFTSRLTSLVVFFSLITFASLALAEVNGELAENHTFQAIVYLDVDCTGTFIAEDLVLTAAHCLPECPTPSARGCVSGNLQDGLVGRNGSIAITAFDGEQAGTGNMYNLDLVFFPTTDSSTYFNATTREHDLTLNRLPDIAILHSDTPFEGEIIPVLDSKILPQPGESRYCKRWEHTSPSIVGYSDNTNGSTRRVANAFAECDLEFDDTAFKLDGHDRDNIKGARLCKGDAGGPVLWQSANGKFAVGGVSSATGDYKFITDTQCPSEHSESYISFIPNRFVGVTTSYQSSIMNYSFITEQQFASHNKSVYIGTGIDQCGESELRIPTVHGHVIVRRGENTLVHLRDGAGFRWYCGRSVEWPTVPDEARLFFVKRALIDNQVIWDGFIFLSPPHE